MSMSRELNLAADFGRCSVEALSDSLVLIGILNSISSVLSYVRTLCDDILGRVLDVFHSNLRKTIVLPID